MGLKIYWPAEDETVTFQVAYRLTNLATRWADVGELYWQYVPADEGSGQEWQNVTCIIHLPVPEGERVIPGENVRAWAHGPLDGELSFSGNDVVFFSPGVGSSEFLEARVTMPQGWLSEAPAKSEAHLDTVMAEEDQWAKDANAARLRARLAYWGFPILMIVLALASFGAAFGYVKGLFIKKEKSTFKEKYFRDVPTDDHPAVLGMLYHKSELTGTEFTATLMNLADRGLIDVDRVTHEEQGRFGRTKEVSEWRLTRVHVPVKKNAYAFAQTERGKEIDDAAMSFLFKTLAGNKSLDDRLRGAYGEPYVLQSFFEDVAHKAKDDYRKGYERWSGAVRSDYDTHKFTTCYPSSEIYPGLLGLADFALATILGFVGILLESQELLLTLGVILLFAAGIYCVMVNDEGPRIVYTRQAAELRDKLKALRRWLLDFTRLKEAIPTDVVLWNRLLVMATVLGVSEQVIKQLKVCAPELLENEGLDAYSWYGVEKAVPTVLGGAALAGAVAARPRSSGSTHSYSSSTLSSSRDSSSRGSGGGFSGGGGGGFSGGGGRGGAF